jgi:hypothetical protein
MYPALKISVPPQKKTVKTEKEIILKRKKRPAIVRGNSDSNLFSLVLSLSLSLSLSDPPASSISSAEAAQQQQRRPPLSPGKRR